MRDTVSTVDNKPDRMTANAFQPIDKPGEILDSDAPKLISGRNPTIGKESPANA